MFVEIRTKDSQRTVINIDNISFIRNGVLFFDKEQATYIDDIESIREIPSIVSELKDILSPQNFTLPPKNQVEESTVVVIEEEPIKEVINEVVSPAIENIQDQIPTFKEFKRMKEPLW